MKNHSALLLLLVAIAFAVSPLLNPEFGGFDPNRYPVPQVDPPVQPAGYAFGIWGPIYLWLLVLAGFGLWKRRHAPDWQAMRPPLIVSLAVGAAWLPVALVSPVGATVMIWVMLVTALAALMRAPSGDRGFALLPVALYAGWLTAASFVAVGLLLAGYGWTGETAAAWICLTGALLLALDVIRRRVVSTYGFAVVWALVAVAIQNLGDDIALVTGAIAGAVVVAAAVVWRMRQV